jgi:hypothetical protein
MSPLSGIRVLDVPLPIPGPFCTAGQEAPGGRLRGRRGVADAPDPCHGLLSRNGLKMRSSVL